ncbi:hypothetical protein B0T21DRAFT_380907 [Apiosordaria backusii]|uniref:Uncharacterized protein n=1 Tax=Apiosordaria backusii TaxID=314023 RepID=A0AA40ESJ8_9PEZI|nr:hypothetical protein B0T21DRAFT_380907 [Apiosordaria backusii]
MVSTTLPQQLLFLLLLVVSIRISVAADCFYFHEKTTDLTQCSNDEDPKAGSTLCCAPGDICMKNSLCLHKEDKKDDLYYRGGCTIESWVGENINDCPLHVCKPKKMAEMIPCNSSHPDTPFYCKEDYPRDIHRLEKCEHANQLFGGNLRDVIGTASIPPSSSDKKSTSSPEPTETEDKGDPVRASSETITSSSSASTATDSPIATAPTQTPEVSPPIATDPPTTAGPTRTPNITASTAPEESATAPPIPPPDEPEQNSRAVPIGVGTGVGIAVAIAGGFFAFFYIRKRQRAAPVRAETPPPLDPNIQKPDNNYYPFVPYRSTSGNFPAEHGSMSSRNDHLRQPKIPIVTESVVSPREDNVYPGQPRYQPPKRTFSHELA